MLPTHLTETKTDILVARCYRRTAFTSCPAEKCQQEPLSKTSFLLSHLIVAASLLFCALSRIESDNLCGIQQTPV